MFSIKRNENTRISTIFQPITSQKNKKISENFLQNLKDNKNSHDEDENGLEYMTFIDRGKMDEKQLIAFYKMARRRVCLKLDEIEGLIDVDKNNDLANEYNINSIPHIFLFHKGSKVMDFKGYDTNSLEKMIYYITKNINKFAGKGVSVGGGEAPKAKNYEAKVGDIPEEPPESDDTYEISFRYNNDVFSRRFLCVNTIGQLKSYIRSKIGVSNISLFTPFPRKVYDDDNQILLDAGLSKREMLNVGLI
jgi:hypothetical protein